MRFPKLMLQAVVTSLAVLASAYVAGADTSAYQQSVEKWRQSYEAGLKADGGWLTVSGLFWLHEGENRFGSDPLSDIVLPASSVPAAAGYFDFHAGKTVVYVNPGVPLMLKGKAADGAELQPDSGDVLTIGDLTLFVHGSGDRLGIRVKDKNSKIRKEFTGLQWYPIDEAYHVTARYVPYDSPKSAEVPNILGDTEKVSFAGYVTFSLRGQDYRLDAEAGQTGRLFIVFRDLTSGKETYPAARFLDAEAPKDGSVVLDFNQARNPPCAYNPYTTCPLPAPGNRLRVEIPAGEKTYSHH
ncbi:MAG TPA: DUF1684 domain-containing protein [Candidatus Angelobacter sp.]|jgi:hypothetical protein|nr:DUF1684 domain-containing protein [Candidatus Angelobacter sp.]